MKKFFKGFGKFIGYTFLYAFITIITAVGVLFFSKEDKGAEQKQSSFIAAQVSNAFNNLTKKPAMNVKLELDITTSEKTFKVQADADVNLDNGLENLELKGKINIYIGEQFIPININFANGTIFVEVFNGRFMINTENLMSSISQIVEILGVEMPSLDIDLESLGIDGILGMLSNLTERVEKDNIILDIEVPVVGNLQVICDKNYNIRKIDLPETQISEGTSIALGANISYPEKVDIKEPDEKNYINATNLIDALTCVLDYVKEDNIALNMTLNSSKLNLDGKLYANIGKKSLLYQMEIDALGQNLSLYIMGGVAYIELGNINLKFDLSELPAALELLNEKLNLNVPVETLTKILAALKSNNLKDIISSFELTESSLDNINLDIIKKFEETESGYVLEIDGIGEIEIAMSDGHFNGITLDSQSKDIYLNLSVDKFEKYNLTHTETDYIDVAQALPAISSLIDTYKLGNIEGTANLAAGNFSAGISYAISIDKNLIKTDLKSAIQAHLEVTIFDDMKIYVEYLNGKVYLSYKDINIVADGSDIGSIMDLIKKFEIEGLDSSKLDNLSTSMKDIFKIILSPTTATNLIKSLSADSGTLTLTLFNDIAVSLGYNNLLTSLSLQIKNVSVNASITASENKYGFATPAYSKFVEAKTVIPKISAIVDYIKMQQIYISFKTNIKDVELGGNINYTKDGGLTVSALATTQGVAINLVFEKNIIYIDLANLKIKFDINDIDDVIDFVKTEFNYDLSTTLNGFLDIIKSKDGNIDLSSFDNLLSNADINKIISIIKEIDIKLDGDLIVVTHPKLSATLTFDAEKLKNLSIGFSGITIDAKVENTPAEIGYSGEYFNIKQIMPFISIIKNYLATKQYNIVANADVFEDETQIYNADNIILQADFFEKTLQFYVNANVVGCDGTKAEDFNLSLKASLYENFMYFNYNGLALKMTDADLENLLGILLNVLNVDANVLPQVKNLFTDQEVDTSVFKSLLTKLTKKSDSSESGSALSLINMIKSFSVSEDGKILTIKLDGSFLSTNERAEYMEIIITTDGTNLKQIVLNNLYTGVTNNEHFDLTVDFYALQDGVTAPDTESSNYIDVSGADALVDALVNTIVNYKTFQIKGNLSVKVNLGIDWPIPLDIRIRLVQDKDGKFSPEITAAIGPIPVKSILNNDTPWFLPEINNRTLYLHYKDKYIYLYRYETRKKGDSYEKALKVHIDTFMDDILYYLKWGTGLSKSIMDEIRKSLDLTKGYEPDLSKVIKSFSTPQSNNSKYYKIDLNMQAITGNDKINIASIGIGISQKDGKNVLANATLNLGMLDNFMSINSTDLSAGLGGDLDFSDFESFISSYAEKNGVENIEYIAENKNWIRDDKEREFTIDFDPQYEGLTAGSIKGKLNTPITLPTFDDQTIDGKTYKTIYHFCGWYTDPSCKDEFLFSETAIPHYNITLYGKWVVKDSFVTVEYYDAYSQKSPLHEQYVQVVRDFELLHIDLLDLVEENIEVLREDGKYLDRMHFVGWFDEKDFLHTRVPEENIKLYAKYEVTETLTLNKLNIFTGVGGNNKELNYDVYSTYDLSKYLPNYELDAQVKLNDGNGTTTIYLFKGWFIDDAHTQPLELKSMPDEILNVYAKWEYLSEIHECKLTIWDNDKEYVYSFAENTAVVIPSEVRIDENTEWYTDSGFMNKTTLPEVMPGENITLYIRNKYHIKYTYYKNVGGVHTPVVYEVDLYQGETFKLIMESNYEIVYKYPDGTLKNMTPYIFGGYEMNGVVYADTNEVTIENHDMEFALHVDDTNVVPYIQINFHTDWSRPGGWVTDGKNEDTSGQHIDSIYVLKGSYLQGLTLHERTSVLNESYTERTINAYYNCTYGGKLFRYYFEADSWNTDSSVGCQNKYNHSHVQSNTEKMVVDENTNDFYIIWKHVK